MVSITRLHYSKKLATAEFNKNMTVTNYISLRVYGWICIHLRKLKFSLCFF
jgi:hypothetical protein